MRRNPFDELEDMVDRLSRQVEEGMMGGPGFTVPGSVAVDVADHPEEYVVTADLPGYDTENIDLTFSEGTLRLEAEREHEEEFESGDEDGGVGERSEPHYIRRERSRRSVSRRVRLPEPVEEEEISASYRNGVLTVTLPKESGDEESRQIDIE